MSETKLLSCPFCGGQLRRNMCGSFEDDNKGCILYGFEIHEKMIPMWNTRKPMEKIVERLEKVKTKGYVTGITANPYEFATCSAMDRAIRLIKEEGFK